MSYTVSSNFIESAEKQFSYYKLLGEKTIDQLSEEELSWSQNSETNSIATLIHHLHGNMMSRWTDLLTSDGEKIWRHRDKEFMHVDISRDPLMDKWNEGWNKLFSALNTIDNSTIDTTIYIRNEGHSVVEAVNRQLCHYAYHIGQMVHIGKSIKGKEWKTLSIPRGESEQYNKTKFDKIKSVRHFTDH